MSTVDFQLTGGLSEGQVVQIHQTALRVLDEVGVELREPELLGLMTGRSGIRVEGTHVNFDAEMVDGLVQAYRAKRPAPSPPGQDFSLEILTGYSIYLVDPETDALRPMTTDDCIETAKLVGSLHARGVRGGTPGMPQDVPVQLRQLLAYKIGCLYTRTNGWVGYTTFAEAEYIRRMAEASGGPFGLSIFPRNPLILEGPTLSMALEYTRRQIPVDMSITGMPLRGVSTPFYFPAAFVESLATTLAAFTVFASLGVEIPFSVQVFPFDLRQGIIAYGTPEHVLCNLWGYQVSRYYGCGWGIAQAMHTNAVYPDAHTLLQRGSFATACALAGARYFGYGGLGGVDLTFSPELLLYDVELLDYLKHLVRPVDFTPETLGFDILKEVGAGGDFLTHDSTVEHCREIWASNLLVNHPVERWYNGEIPRPRELARQQIKELLAGYEYEVDPAVAREVEEIYRRAVEELG